MSDLLFDLLINGILNHGIFFILFTTNDDVTFKGTYYVVILCWILPAALTANCITIQNLYSIRYCCSFPCRIFQGFFFSFKEIIFLNHNSRIDTNKKYIKKGKVKAFLLHTKCVLFYGCLKQIVTGIQETENSVFLRNLNETFLWVLFFCLLFHFFLHFSFKGHENNLNILQLCKVQWSISS